MATNIGSATLSITDLSDSKTVTCSITNNGQPLQQSYNKSDATEIFSPSRSDNNLVLTAKAWISGVGGPQEITSALTNWRWSDVAIGGTSIDAMGYSGIGVSQNVLTISNNTYVKPATPNRTIFFSADYLDSSGQTITVSSSVTLSVVRIGTDAYYVNFGGNAKITKSITNVEDTTFMWADFVTPSGIDDTGVIYEWFVGPTYATADRLDSNHALVTGSKITFRDTSQTIAQSGSTTAPSDQGAARNVTASTNAANPTFTVNSGSTLTAGTMILVTNATTGVKACYEVASGATATSIPTKSTSMTWLTAPTEVFATNYFTGTGNLYVFAGGNHKGLVIKETAVSGTLQLKCVITDGNSGRQYNNYVTIADANDAYTVQLKGTSQFKNKSGTSYIWPKVFKNGAEIPTTSLVDWSFVYTLMNRDSKKAAFVTSTDSATVASQSGTGVGTTFPSLNPGFSVAPAQGTLVKIVSISGVEKYYEVGAGTTQTNLTLQAPSGSNTWLSNGTTGDYPYPSASEFASGSKIYKCSENITSSMTLDNSSKAITSNIAWDGSKASFTLTTALNATPVDGTLVLVTNSGGTISRLYEVGGGTSTTTLVYIQAPVTNKWLNSRGYPTPTLNEFAGGTLQKITGTVQAVVDNYDIDVSGTVVCTAAKPV